MFVGDPGSEKGLAARQSLALLFPLCLLGLFLGMIRMN